MADSKNPDQTEDFALLEVAIIQIGEYQYAINARHLDQYIYEGELIPRGIPIEKIPAFEMIGRRICGVCYRDGIMIISLATKPDGKQSRGVHHAY